MTDRRQRLRRSDDRGGKPACPQCGCRWSAVIDGDESKIHPDAYRRRRECTECHRRFTTFEIIDPCEDEAASTI